MSVVDDVSGVKLSELNTARDNLTYYGDHKIISLSYESSQLFVGFDFEISGGTTFDLHILEALENRDAVKLSALLREHLKSTWEKVSEFM